MIERFLKFAGIGGIATAIQYILLVLFVEYFQIPPLEASVASYILSALCNYWMNYHITFSSSASHTSTLPKFAIVAGIGLVINTIVFQLALSHIGIYILSQVIATSVVLLWNFFANHYWSFSEKI